MDGPLAVATDGEIVQLWDIRTGKVKTELIGHQGSVGAVAYSPNGSVLASGGNDRKIRLWHAASGELLFTFPEQLDSIMSITFSPDGQRIASGTVADIYISDLATGKHIATLTGHRRPVRSVAFSPDGKLLASGSDDSTVLLWDLTQIELKND